MEVVEEVEDPYTQMSQDEARELDPDSDIGDSLGVKLDTSDFGRIAAQTAKQVIIQRVRDAERDNIYNEYKDRKGEIGGRMESMREKKEIIGDLLKLRKILYLFERVYFRLVELEGYYRQGYGRGQIEPGLSSAAFFNRFNREKEVLGRQMAALRYLTKLYAKRNDGVFPTDLLEQGEEGFFGDEEGFFDKDEDLSF